VNSAVETSGFVDGARPSQSADVADSSAPETRRTGPGLSPLPDFAAAPALAVPAEGRVQFRDLPDDQVDGDDHDDQAVFSPRLGKAVVSAEPPSRRFAGVGVGVEAAGAASGDPEAVDGADFGCRTRMIGSRRAVATGSLDATAAVPEAVQPDAEVRPDGGADPSPDAFSADGVPPVAVRCPTRGVNDGGGTRVGGTATGDAGRLAAGLAVGPPGVVP
jgi:hypothetical protein